MIDARAIFAIAKIVNQNAKPRRIDAVTTVRIGHKLTLYTIHFCFGLRYNIEKTEG